MDAVTAARGAQRRRDQGGANGQTPVREWNPAGPESHARIRGEVRQTRQRGRTTEENKETPERAY